MSRGGRCGEPVHEADALRVRARPRHTPRLRAQVLLPVRSVATGAEQGLGGADHVVRSGHERVLGLRQPAGEVSGRDGLAGQPPLNGLRPAQPASTQGQLDRPVLRLPAGGGGIFNLYSTVASDNAFANYVFVHEFGHHFAALADEYYTSDVAYETGGTDHPEPDAVAARARVRPGCARS